MLRGLATRWVLLAFSFAISPYRYVVALLPRLYFSLFLLGFVAFKPPAFDSMTTQRALFRKGFGGFMPSRFHAVAVSGSLLGLQYRPPFFGLVGLIVAARVSVAARLGLAMVPRAASGLMALSPCRALGVSWRSHALPRAVALPRSRGVRLAFWRVFGTPNTAKCRSVENLKLSTRYPQTLWITPGFAPEVP